MNLKFSTFSTLICIIIFLISSCNFIQPPLVGNGKIIKQERTVNQFNKISVSRGLDVHIVQGPEKLVLVEANENLLDCIETKVEDKTLKITTSKNIRRSNSTKIFVTNETIDGIKAFAGSQVYAVDKLKSKKLEISSNAGSLIKLNLETGKLNAKASAGSNIKLQGNSMIISARASSGSNIRAEELTASDCDVKASSGSNIWINSNNRIIAQASSGGNIFYFGSPKVMETSKSSGGNIIKK